MKVLLQRVSRASVSVNGNIVGEIGHGLLLLIGIGTADSDEQLEWMAGKIVNLRVFADEQGRMNRSLLEAAGNILAISQFTLYADTSRGNRPGYTQAAPPEQAAPLYDRFCSLLEVKLGKPVARGVFGAHMDVALINSGPVTIMLER